MLNASRLTTLTFHRVTNVIALTVLIPTHRWASLTIKKISLCLLEEVNLNHRSHRSDTTRTSAAHLSTSRYNLVLLWYLPNISLISKVLSAESLAKPKSSSVFCHAIKS